MSGAPDNRSTRALRRLVVALLLGGILVGAGVGLGCRLAKRTPLPEPPAVSAADLDPAVGRAITLARAEVQSSPRSADSWGRLGAVLLAHQFAREAAVCYARAEQLDGGEVRWPYLQAVALQRLDPGEAIACLRRAAERGGDEAGVVRLRLGELLLASGQIEEAETQFRRALEVRPDSARANLGLGRLECQRESLAASLPHLRRAAADPHARKAATLLLAQTHQRLGDVAAAAGELKRAHDLPDDSPWPDPFMTEVTARLTGHLVNVTRANELLQQDRAAEAVPLLRQTLRDSPDSDRAWYLLGKALAQGHDLAGAEAALRAANERAPAAVEYQFELGVVLYLEGKPNDAVAYFRRATELKPDFTRAYYNLGLCLKHQGDVEGVLAAWRSAVRCQPGLAVAHAGLGALLAQKGKKAEALVHLRQAISLDPDDKLSRQLLEKLQKQSDGSKPKP